MHEITGNREAVLSLLEKTIKELGGSAPQTKKATAQSLGLKADRQLAPQRDQMLDALKRGLNNERVKGVARGGAEALSVSAGGRRAAAEPVPNERAVASTYAPRDRAIAIFQAAMDEFLEEKVGAASPAPTKGSKKSSKKASKKDAQALSVGGATWAEAAPRATLEDFFAGKPSTKKAGKASAKKGTAQAAGLFPQQYSNFDPRWITVVTEKAKALIRGKHNFPSHKSVTDFRFKMKDEATIAITGDWGGGNDAAQAVAKQIRALNPDHVIHLGDVYYAGTEREVRDRFLKFWPAPTDAGRSFALNSNHEMYSGGYGYFDVTLPAFKQPASYFSLANKNWRFIGLDTGYVEHDLNAEQVAWLRGQFKGNNPKTIFLSHHQLFSAYENTDASNLVSRVKPFLDARQIYAWFWGHEHLNVVYKDHMGTKGRCLGNSCFPYDVPKQAKTKVPVEWLNKRTTKDDYPGIHSYAVLRVRGASIDVEYVDQDGFVGFRETLS